MMDARGDALDSGLSPLTFQQEVYWELYRRGDCVNRLIICGLLLSGSLSVEALRKSLEDLVRRHDALRTRIVMADGSPRQRVEGPDYFRPQVLYDVRRAESDADLRERARAIAREFADRPRSSTAGPIFEVKVVKLSDQKHVLAWVVHRFLTDGISLDLMFRKLWDLYAQCLNDGSSPVGDMSLQYVEYGMWQRQAHQAWIDKHRSFWDGRLAGATGIRWPFRRDAAAMRPGGFASGELSFGKKLSAELRELSLRQRSSPSLAVLSVYVAVVSRWCKQKDFIVATTATGRERAEHRNVLGLLAHMLYLRVQLSGEESFVELLQRMTREYYQTLLRKDCGGIVAAAPQLIAHTVFQWMPWSRMDLLGGPTLAESAALGIASELLLIELEPPLADRVDLQFLFSDGAEGIGVKVPYRTSVVEAETINRLMQDLRATAEQLVRNPGSRWRRT